MMTLSLGDAIHGTQNYKVSFKSEWLEHLSVS